MEDGKGILGSWLTSDGSGSDVIEIPAGGVRVPIPSDNFEEGMQYFHMDGRAVWNFAIEAFPQAVLSALERVGKSLDEVELSNPSSGQYQYHQNRNGKTWPADGKDIHKFAQVRKHCRCKCTNRHA